MKPLNSYLLTRSGGLFGFLCLIHLLTLPLNLSAQESGHALCINVQGLDRAKGQIVFDIYKDEDSFKAESPFKSYRFEKKWAEGGRMECIVYLKPGRYGIAMVDDKNRDGKMNRNLIGYPMEGFGFSMLKLKKLRRPDFEEFSFSFNKDFDSIDIYAFYSRFF